MEEEKAKKVLEKQERECQEQEKKTSKPRATYAHRAMLTHHNLSNLSTASGDSGRSLTPTDIEPELSSPETSPPSTSYQQIKVKPAHEAESNITKLVLAIRGAQAFSRPKKKIKLLPSTAPTRPDKTTPDIMITPSEFSYDLDGYEPPITAGNKFRQAAVGISTALSIKPKRLQLLPASRPAQISPR